MNFDWVTNLLPILNAAGIPLLALGLILLLRAYQKSVESYKDVTLNLRDENERLRKRLTEIEISYFDELDKAREIASKSMEAIETLRTTKANLLSEYRKNPDENLSSEAAGIGEAIKMLKELSTAFKLFDLRMREHIIYTRREFDKLMARPIETLERVVDYIQDNSIKLAIIQVLNSVDALDTRMLEEASEIKEKDQEENLLSIEKQAEILEKLLNSGALEKHQIDLLVERLVGKTLEKEEQLHLQPVPDEAEKSLPGEDNEQA